MAVNGLSSSPTQRSLFLCLLFLQSQLESFPFISYCTCGFYFLKNTHFLIFRHAVILALECSASQSQQLTHKNGTFPEPWVLFWGKMMRTVRSSQGDVQISGLCESSEGVLN